jgi:O-antigen ligase
VGLLRRNIELAPLVNRRSLYLAILWLCYALSYYFGPYVEVQGPYRFTDPGWALSTFNNIFILYFVACVCITSPKRLQALTVVMIGSAVYLIYWANSQYLSGRLFGRLAGPTNLEGVGIYSDENSFAMLFVVALPFLWYLGYAVKNRVWRWGLWLIIPFGWHAVFLTASRAGLLGLGATSLLIALRSRRKALGLLLVPAFITAYIWQAGDLMRERAETIGEFRTETSAATRLEAWQAALGMIAEHPLTGVGLASFGPAFPDYSDKKPREAHNSFLQISAESGVVAGAMYVLIVTGAAMALWRNGRRLARLKDLAGDDYRVYLTNEAIFTAFCGLVVCSLFASLQMYEIFYFLCLMASVTLYVSSGRVGEVSEPEHRLAGPRVGVP